jgi:hypothetical protein
MRHRLSVFVMSDRVFRPKTLTFSIQIEPLKVSIESNLCLRAVRELKFIFKSAFKVSVAFFAITAFRFYLIKKKAG